MVAEAQVGGLAMETTFRLSYVPPSDGVPLDYSELFKKVAEIICEECGDPCAKFFLTENVDKYQMCSGPKIGWAVDEGTILLRMANCRQLNRTSRIAQLLHHFGMNVLESKLIH
jgi:hypothetical protein